jgi:hypothetical protein
MKTITLHVPPHVERALEMDFGKRGLGKDLPGSVPTPIDEFHQAAVAALRKATDDPEGAGMRRVTP